RRTTGGSGVPRVRWKGRLLRAEPIRWRGAPSASRTKGLGRPRGARWCRGPRGPRPSTLPLGDHLLDIIGVLRPSQLLPCDDGHAPDAHAGSADDEHDGILLDHAADVRHDVHLTIERGPDAADSGQEGRRLSLREGVERTAGRREDIVPEALEALEEFPLESFEPRDGALVRRGVVD